MGLFSPFRSCGRDSTRSKQRLIDVLDPGRFDLRYFLLTVLVGRPWLMKA